MEVNVFESLKELQKSCIVPKNLRNNFGGYNFRNIEQINQEIKKKYKDSDKIVIKLDRELITQPCFSVTKREIKYDESGKIKSEIITEYKGRDYIRSTASIIDGTTTIESSAIMRVPFEKKGIDDSQIMAATTSFADKYAMGGLLLVSDGIDNDALINEDKTGSNLDTSEDASIDPIKKQLNQKMHAKKMENKQRVDFFIKHTDAGMSKKEILENFEELYTKFMEEQNDI